MREIDIELVNYFKITYSPFSCKLIQNKHVHSSDPEIEQQEIADLSFGNETRNRMHKCDFCGEKDATKIVRADSTLTDKSLFICLACPALQVLIGQEQADQVMFEGIDYADGLVEFPAGQEEFARAAADAMKLQKLIGTGKIVGSAGTTLEELKVLIATTRNYHKAGMGKGWVIIPDLLSQYDKKGRLSEKQIDVLRRHNKACADHVIKRKS